VSTLVDPSFIGRIVAVTVGVGTVRASMTGCSSSAMPRSVPGTWWWLLRALGIRITFVWHMVSTGIGLWRRENV
jgi:hypothetical protein